MPVRASWTLSQKNKLRRVRANFRTDWPQGERSVTNTGRVPGVFQGRVLGGNSSWQFRLMVLGLQLLGAIAYALTVSAPMRAAERVIISYGILERSIQVDDLELFAETGELTPQLQAYNQLLKLSDEQLETVRQVLTTPADIQPLAVGQFLYTPQGKLLLKQVSAVVRTPNRRSGFSAIRGAMLLAAAEPNGLTVLSFLQRFPTEAIRIDVSRALAIADDLNRAILQSEQAIAWVEAESVTNAVAQPLNNADYNQVLALLETLSSFQVDVRELTVPGLSVPVRLYLPRSPGHLTRFRGAPLVVISHGLGGDRDTYRYLSIYLAQAGFAVATLEHAGSNAEQLIALQEGFVNAVVDDEEFLRRPQEVSLTLDRIEAEVYRGALQGKIDLGRIGVIGQSFGGYTALELAGARLNLDFLGQNCPPPLVTNLSLLLQCQATLLSDPGNTLFDPRIQAAFVMNPIGSALFGPDGYGQIDVPLMIVSGAADTVAPAFPEQIIPFSWLRQSHRYLLLMGRGTHFSVVGETTPGTEPIPVPPEIIGPEPALARSYMEVFSLAFFQRHLLEDERFQPLLTASFAERFGQEPLPLSMIQALTPSQLQEALQSN